MKIYKSLLLAFYGWTSLLSTAYAYDTYLASNGDDEVSISSPSFKVKLLYYHQEGWDSFWASAPQIYINGEYICTLNGLNMDTEEKAKEYREQDGDINYYQTSNYAIRSYNPYKDDDEFWLQLEILPLKINPGDQYKVEAKGDWNPDRDGKRTVSKSWITPNKVKDEFPSLGSFSRTKEGFIKYSKSGLTKYENGFVYEVGFYKSNNYSSNNCYHKVTLTSDATSTEENCVWSGNSNYTPVNVYHQVKIKNDKYPLGNRTYAVSATKNYGNTVIQGYVKATDLMLQPDQWNKKIKLTWTSHAYSNASSKEGNWVVYRHETGAGESQRKKVATISAGTSLYYDTSSDLEYDKSYTYEVSFIPKGWDSDTPINDLSDSKSASITRAFPITLTTTSNEKSILLTWTCGQFGGNENYKFSIYRKVNNGTFQEMKDWAVTVTDKKEMTYTYEDKDLETSCDTYTYQILINMLGNETFTSNEASGCMEGSTYMKKVVASRGAYSNMVKVGWEVEQVGTSETQFVLSRRLLGSNDTWSKIYTTTGTDAIYSYEDISVIPGQYYEYQIASSYYCEGKETSPQVLTSDGFCLSTGVISGQITYDTGTSVEGVKVRLLTSSDEDHSVGNQFYSLRVDNSGGGIHLNINNDKAAELYGPEQSFSIQMWVNFDEDILNSNDVEQYSTPMLLDVFNNFSFFAKRQSDSTYQMVMRIPGNNKNTDKTTNIYLSPNRFHHLTMSHNAVTKEWRLTVISPNEKVSEASFVAEGSINLSLAEKEGITFGTNLSGATQYDFKGYIDEVRIWNKVLSKEEILKNYNHLLSGTETGLKVYYPLDENIPGQRTAYDYSKTSGVANAMHGSILEASRPSAIVPTTDQFALYALTDADGNYTLRGIPFTSNGITYSVYPSMGIHEFSPNKATRFVSANSLVYSGVDFEDVSSFPVSGVVYYENTTYPVEGCNLKVDGVICTRDGEIITTDEEGRFTISVPIGDHYISVEKSGHTFANEGFYPAKIDGSIQKLTFDREITGLTFTDVTKAIVAGRVAGGSIQQELPLGLGAGKANIGQAELKLKTGYKMNVKDTIDGAAIEYINATKNLSYAQATEKVKSEAFAGNGNDEYVRTITIRTDPITGEFAVLLPPVKYEVVSATIPSNSEVTFSSIPNIDATQMSLTYSDSLEVDSGIYETFDYHASLELIYRTPSKLSVTDILNSEGAFGEKYDYQTDVNGKKDSVQIYRKTDKGTIEYIYDYPMFFQYCTYQFEVKGYEEYVNYDGNTPVIDHVPLEGTIVTIENEFGAGHQVSTERETDGQIVTLEEDQVKLDENGKAVYQFKAGLPNIQPPYTLGMNISYEMDGNTHSWDQNGEFKAILLGVLPTGNNFVTMGPDEVLMVLRDPPGSNSYAYFEEGTVVQKKKDIGGYSNINVGTTKVIDMGPEITTATGVGIAMIQKNNVENEINTGETINYSFVGKDIVTQTTTVNTTITTSGTTSYVGNNGDLFVGVSKNYIFGKAREVGFHLTEGGEKVLNLEEVMTRGEEYTTGFHYTQHYIETYLLPNLKSLRNSFLKPKGSVTENHTNGLIFVSNLSEDDPKYGSCNNDESVWGADARIEVETITYKDDKTITITRGPSYTILAPSGIDYEAIDSVEHYNTQINLWIETLKENEKAKIRAISTERDSYFKENVSIDAGGMYQGVYKQVLDNTHIEEHKVGGTLFGSYTTGFATNGVGLIWTAKLDVGAGYLEINTDTESEIKTVQYVINDNDLRDALSVDIFDCPNGWSPIFSTRGGQTSCPYEGEVVTKYYEPGSVLSTATMQVEVPKISVDNPIATGVPSGGAAYYTLHLKNNSEINADAWYTLGVFESSNPHGAQLTIDGLTAARAFLIPAGGSITKTLKLTQANPSILDYEDIKICLSSLCQNDISTPFGAITDLVSISAHFVPTCSDIRLQIPNPILNSFTGSTLTMKVNGYDLNYRSLKGIRIQMKAEGDADWKLVKEFTTDKGAINQNVSLLDQSEITYNFDMSNKAIYPDQNYLFRAITVCNFGEGEVNNESEEITVIKDMVSPTLIGTTSPADGILESGDEIAIIFNEDIRNGSLTAADNIVVKGVLNESEVTHHVAYKAGEGYAAATEATIDLSRRSFAVNLWINYTDKGQIFSHGTSSNELEVEVDDTGRLTVSVNDTTYVSKKSIPTNTWAFFSFMVTHEAENTTFSAEIAYDTETNTLFNAQQIDEYNGNGTLRIGDGLTGSIHEVTLWNYARSSTEAFSEKYQTKAPYTKGLIGYWKFDEGHGTIAEDAVRSRHMVLPSENVWKLNNVNKSLSLSGNSIASIPIGACPTTDEDNYLIEFWFKGDNEVQADTASIFTLGYGTLDLRVAKGNLELVAGNSIYQLAEAKTWLDHTWHHFALNAHKATRGRVTIYLDGTAVKQLSTDKFPNLSGDYLFLGAKRSKMAVNDSTIRNVYSNYFTGQFDEFRYWKGTFSAEIIRGHIYNRIDEKSAGLMAYYPFEKQMVDEYNQTVYVPDLSDRVNDAAKIEVIINDNNGGSISIINWDSEDTPALKPAPLMENVSFSFVASERKILINIEEEASKVEDCTLFFTIRDVRDATNNLSDVITWTAYVQQNRLKWDEEEVALRIENNNSAQFSVRITNTGTETEYWSLSDLPLWLEADIESGVLEPLSSQEIHFSIPSSTAVGRYEEVVYLTGNQNIPEPLVVKLTSAGNIPDWSVNSEDFEFAMSLIGQLWLEGRNGENPENILAAFINETCVGVCQPTYIDRYDAWYLMMNIYGRKELKGKSVKFKAYDATAGIIYPSVIASPTIVLADTVAGSMDSPVFFTVDNKLQQEIALNKGWKWISLALSPENNSVSKIMKEQEEVTLVKGKNSFVQYNENDNSWKGSLETMQPGLLYKVYSEAASNLSIIGTSITAEESIVTIVPGWNWIGYPSLSNLPLETALAGLDPQTGDFIKGQYAFSVYDDYEWIGTLDALRTGEGYVFYSASEGERTLKFPTATASVTRTADTPSSRTSAYSGNMSIVGIVMNGTKKITDAHVSLYTSTNELRGKSETVFYNDESLCFITVQGEGYGEPLQLVVDSEGENITLSTPLYFSENAILGTLANPYVIQLEASAREDGIVLQRTGEGVMLSSASFITSVVLHDAGGRVMQSVKEKAKSSIYLPLNALANGIYFITAETKNGYQRTFRISN